MKKLLCVTLCALYTAGCGGSTEPPAPTLALAEVIRGQMTVSRPGGADPVQVVLPARVEERAQVATGADGRGSLDLDSGAWLLFDRGSQATLTTAAVELSQGRIWVDGSAAEQTTVSTSHGSISGQEATFAVSLSDQSMEVYCGAGEVTYRAQRGSGQIQQGESITLTATAPPEPEPEGLWDDWTGGLADPTPRRYHSPTAVGALAGRRLNAFGRARVPLPVQSHEVSATVTGELARTEVVQTFFNAASETLEAEYTVRVPRGAIVSGFSVDLGEGFVDAAVCHIQSSSGYQISWADPATGSQVLSYDGPDRLRARVYPVTAGARVRVRFEYVEWLERRDDVRTYVYPMGSRSAAAPMLGELIVQVNAEDAGAGAFRAGMGAVQSNGIISLRRSDYRPRADFYLDLIDPQASGNQAEAKAVAYVVDAPRDYAVGEAAEGTEQYVLFDIPTFVEEQEDEGEPPLEIALLLDVSGATDGENLELARAIVESTLRQLAPTDRVALLLGDVTAHPPPGLENELVEVGADSGRRLVESLARVELGGATDLGRSLREAAALVAGRPRGAVLYLGDGLPTTGAMDATALRAQLAAVDSPPQFFALGIGDGSNIGLLRALFGDQARVVHHRTDAGRAVMHVLAAAARPTLRGVDVDLGATVERVYPRSPITLPAASGGRLKLVGRLRGELPERIVVRAVRDGQPFVQEMEVDEQEVEDHGDIRRRWATHRLAELLDEDAGQEALVELGIRFEVITPWTSLVVGGVKGNSYQPIQSFDHNPWQVPWALGGGGARLSLSDIEGSQSGWRRRTGHATPQIHSLPEATWVSRVDRSVTKAPPAGRGGGEESLARAATARALSLGERGPRGCFERRLIVRPDMSGFVNVQVQVDGAGEVQSTQIVTSSVNDGELEQCVETEVRGIRFPATGAARPVTLTHRYELHVPARAIGVRSHCSDASSQPLEVRRNLWRERLAANRGVTGALSVWREANQACELGTWRARRTLLGQMLGRLGIQGQIQLYRSFGAGSQVAPFLLRSILRRVRTPQEVAAVRQGLGLEVPVDWRYFSYLWNRATSAQARLRLVRRWLEALPKDMDLRLRLLALLEETGQIDEARRLAYELRGDPLADAQVRTKVGEFWLRRNNEPEARRVFSEIVERAPYDPWARRRLGDLYRAHGWADDAYREYSTLARLMPADPSVVLLLARAAAEAGRIDEALRLEQRLSESVEEGSYEGTAAFARLWTTVRLARLKAARPEGLSEQLIAERQRSSGALRDPPDLLIALTWEHPDDMPQLALRRPSTEANEDPERAPLQGPHFGIEAIREREREPGDYQIVVTRPERDELRDTEAQLLVISMPGTDDEHIRMVDVTLTRERRTLTWRLGSGAELTAVE